MIPDGWTVAKDYMLRGSFLIDFLATVPSYLEVGTPNSELSLV